MGTWAISLPVVPERYQTANEPGTSSNLEGLYHSSSAGQTCSSFFLLVQQLVLVRAFHTSSITHLVTFLEPVNHKLMSLAAILRHL